MDKKKLIEALEELILLKELSGENPFKIRAYENVINIVQRAQDDIGVLIENGDLKNTKGIGEKTYAVITEFYKTGKIKEIEELKKEFPAGLFDILKIPGLGPKRVKELYEELHIKTVGELKYACHENRLTLLKGFGEKMQESIIKGIENLSRYRERFLLSEALLEAEEALAALKKTNLFYKVEIVGSLRRRKETVKDIDIVAEAKDAEKAADAFVNLPQIKEITAQGETKLSALFKSGINCDLRLFHKNGFTEGLLHFTGSKEHNTLLRAMAKKEGLKINEYGVFKGDKKIPLKSEEEFYSKIFNMQYVPPELREGLNEIERAKNKKIPPLVERKDIKGIFHIHTSSSDGSLTLKEIADLLKNKGYSYAGISDHSRSARYAGGLEADRLLKQLKDIKELNLKLKDFVLFSGVESDILPDGKLDYENKVLKELDFIIASVHSKFKMSKKDMTKRICSALKNKYTTALGHPTGRLLLSREAYEVDIKEVIDTAAGENKMIEINCNPHRLDLDWRNIDYALKKKITFMLSPDAHDTDGFDYIKYGVWMSRKGMLEAKNILNTFPAEKVKDMLKKS